MNRFSRRTAVAALTLASALAGCIDTRSEEAPTKTYAPVNLPNLNSTEREFIDRMMPHALRLEDRAYKQGLYMPADAVLAQWAVETGYGKDRIARENFNFGGITCDNEPINPDRCTQFEHHKFRKFDNDTEGTDATYTFIVGNKTNRYYEVLHARTPEEYMDGMGRNGYAEDYGAYSRTLRKFYNQTPFAAAVAQARQSQQPVYAQQDAQPRQPQQPTYVAQETPAATTEEARSTRTDAQAFSIEIKYKRTRPRENRGMNLPMPSNPNRLFGR